MDTPNKRLMNKLNIPVVLVVCFVLISVISGSLVQAGTLPRRTNVESKARQEIEPLKLVGEIPLRNVSGRIDHLDVDVHSKRLFVAALGNNSVEVVDLQAGKRIQSIPGFDEPQGIRFLPDVQKVVVANGGNGVVRIIDAASFKITGTVDLDGDADNVRYDVGQRRVYVGYGRGALAILSADGKILRDIPLGGHPESFRLDSTTSRIYVNVPGRRRIAVIDSKNLKVMETWPVENAGANFPMALDPEHHRLFTITRRPSRFLVYNTETGRPVVNIPAGIDCDDIFYDRLRHRLYATLGEGKVAVYNQINPDEYKLIAEIPTGAGARTGFFSPSLHQLYVAVPQHWQSAAKILVYQVKD